MNVHFGTAHMKTIAKLSNLAKTHGFVININFGSETSPDADFGMIAKIDGKKFSALAEDLPKKRESSETSSIGFEMTPHDSESPVLSLV